MDAVNNYLLNSLNSYFNALSKLGYVSYNKVDKLIAALFLIEILEVGYNSITEESYRDIRDALTCLLGSNCLLPYPEFKRNATEEMKHNPFL